MDALRLFFLFLISESFDFFGCFKPFPTHHESCSCRPRVVLITIHEVLVNIHVVVVVVVVVVNNHHTLLLF